MSDLWAYVPEICDGDFCPYNCEHCYKRDKAEEYMMEAEEDEEE